MLPGGMPFITFEGVEGCGKSTQLAMAGSRLRAIGAPVLETREPGGTQIGRGIRNILMDASYADLDPIAEWLLLEADRRQHVREVLRPAIARNVFVLCDRYSDATEAYQQEGRGLDRAAVGLVDALAREGVVPDLTLLYDLDPEQGLSRAQRRDGQRAGRFESADIAFHRRVRTAYLEIAKREPARMAVIDARNAVERVFEETWRLISERFSLRDSS